MSVSRLLITVYFQHSALYSIWIFLWMDGSAADSAMSCKQFSNPDTETTVFKDDGCFILSREDRTWEESQTFCNGLGDGWSLVEIEDAETQKHVDSVTRTAGVSTGSWIGLRQRNGFTWVTGKRLGYPGFFKELAVGEVQSTGDCVTTSPPDVTASYGIWSYMDCTARLYSICHSGSSLPPRKTMTSRRTTASTMTVKATPAKPQTTVKYGATQSTAATTQSTATTTQSIATTQSTATTTQSTPTTTQSTAPTTQSTATTTQSTATTTQSTAATTQSTATTMQSTVTTTQSTATTMQSTEAATTQSTAAMTTSSTTVLIAVSSTAAFVAAVFLVGGVIALCRRNKQKRLRVRTNDTMAGDDTESGTVADVRTKPEVEYAVVTKIQTKQSSQVNDCNTESGYHYASVDDGALPMKQGVNDQTYDTATITEKKQPITFDNTYARAIFSQSASDTGDDVYDHTRVSGKASQEVDASHYDHAFVK
ncbi:location of vulva defective 1-like isoform X2 [Haliotis rufescens]|uniref:location of vulva defective 1-like isoform X2 n=1 Tax=Haliotis rufescens TaxID=6454 RepID=UPI00201FAFBC|nr:location of vulva defective 1-like isoform X2 [Haliotis rufescens]